jgi:hypothetical protein
VDDYTVASRLQEIADAFEELSDDRIVQISRQKKHNSASALCMVYRLLWTASI